MGVLVEKFHDDKGIIWPESVAPFRVYLAGLNRDDASVVAAADAAYEELTKAGIEVLYDDRDIATGAKFTDAELLGIPWRAVISKKTAGDVELASRASGEIITESLSSIIKRLL
jgi:prolyl-tRNA synthetase